MPSQTLESENSNRRLVPAEVNLREGEVRIVESHHAPGFTMALDVWPFHKIAWVAMGAGRLEFEGQLRDLRRDDFLLLPAQCPHRFADDPREPMTLVLFCISTDFIDHSASVERSLLWKSITTGGWTGRPLRARTAFHQSTLLERFRRALREQSAKSAGWEIALCGLADAVLICIAREHLIPGTEGREVGSREAIRGAVEYIEIHPHEPQQIADMAEQCQLSERRFTQLFKEETGESFTTYLNRHRVKYACERLRETGHILYACHESGFNDPAYFYRVFKKQTGLTPGSFLRSLVRE